MNKYRNKKTVVDGIVFDSRKEANYYGMLKLRLLAKDILSFERQIKMPVSIKGMHVCNYIADFKILHPGGREEVIDVKGIRTPVYQLKKKLIKAIYNIDITEI